MNTSPSMLAPLVSIVIPCYNAEAYVQKAIESALGQTHPRVEVIVVDDGSTDGSREVIRAFGNRIKYYQQVNQGAPVARNHGLVKAEGAFVKFLDADDVLREHALAEQVEQAVQTDERILAVGRGRYISEEGELQERMRARPQREGEDPIAYILESNPQTSCPLHRAELLEEVGGFDERLPRAQEYDLHVRLYLAGVRFHYFPTEVVHVRRHQGSHRITNQNHAAKHPYDHAKRVRERARAIKEARPEGLSDPVRRYLASSMWDAGRNVLQQSHREAADLYFSYARALHPGDGRYVGGASLFYRWCVRLLGPFMAEHIGTWAREVRRFVSRRAWL